MSPGESRGEPSRLRLGRFHQRQHGAIHRRRRALRVGQRDHAALELVDLGEAVLLQVVGHRRARLRVDPELCRGDEAKQRVGQTQHLRNQGRRQRTDLRRADPRRGERRQRLVDAARQQPAPGAVRDLLAQRHAGERVERVVEVEQQLAPGDRAHVGVRADRQVRGGKRRGQRRRLGVDQDRAVGAAVKAPLAERGDVERHHPCHHLPSGQRLLEDRGVVDAVLQRDHDRRRRRMPQDAGSDLARRTALHGDEHHVRFAEQGRIDADDEILRGEAQRRAVPIAEGQPMGGELVAQARAGEEAHVATRCGDLAADEAADRAGTGDDDSRGRRRHGGSWRKGRAHCRAGDDHNRPDATPQGPP